MPSDVKSAAILRSEFAIILCLQVKLADGGNELKITGHELSEQSETYRVNLGEALKAGKSYEIEIPFVGSLAAKQTGLYGFAWPDFWEPGPPLMSVTLSEVVDTF